MQALFKYCPARVEQVEKEKKTFPYFFLEVKCDGQPVNICNVNEALVGFKVTVTIGGNQGFDKDGRINIGIWRWGRQQLDLDQDRSEIVKQELPCLLKKLPEYFPQEPVVDLVTGLTVEKKITVEYRFVEGTVIKERVEKQIPAQVFFACPAPDKVVRTDQLCFDPSNHGSYISCENVWTIQLGYNKIPVSIKWPVAEIEAAFCELAKKLIAESDQDIKPWNFKQTTRISLE